MKGSEETLRQATERMEQLSEMAKNLSDISKKTIPDLLERAIREVPKEQRQAAQQFVQDSNELMSKSGKLNFNEVQNLIKKHEQKYGKGNSNK